MNGKRIGFAVAVFAAGCSSTGGRASPEQVHTDVTDRAGVPADWEVAEGGREAVERFVAAKLAGEMTVDDAVAVSLLKNPRLRALYRELGVAESDIVAAGLPENPVFAPSRRFPGKATEFDVTQEFMSVFLIPLRRRIAESAFERERLRVSHDLVDHAAEVRTAYWNAQAAEQMVGMRRSVAQAMDASLAAARALRKAGNAPPLDVAQEERAANGARLDLADAEFAVVESRERLNVLLGLWGEETRWRIAPRLPELPAEDPAPEELEGRAVTDRLDLLSLRAEIGALAASQGLTGVTSLIPDLTLGGHSEREPEGTNTAGPSLSFPVAIFNRGQAARARANYLLLEAEDRYAALAVEVRAQVRLASGRMSLARKKAEFYRRAVLPVQQAVSDQTQLRYNGMFLGVFQLLRAKQAQIDAGRDYVRAIAEYWLARTELEKALGRRLPTGPLRPATVGEPAGEPMTTHHHN
jgi:cobalt-zinc-cadmium efflux system outer membrane protein